MVGKTIAHCEVLDEIEESGIGLAYTARDTRLERKAAIKALPEQRAEDAERLARFEREAQAPGAAEKSSHRHRFWPRGGRGSALPCHGDGREEDAR